MCKLSNRSFITLGSFPVLCLNGEGADTTVGGVESVSIYAELMGVYNGEMEWAFEAHYHRDILADNFDQMNSTVKVYESVIISNLDEFISAFTHFVHNVNETTISRRLGYYALKLYSFTRADIRAMLLVNYGISE